MAMLKEERKGNYWDCNTFCCYFRIKTEHKDMYLEQVMSLLSSYQKWWTNIFCFILFLLIDLVICFALPSLEKKLMFSIYAFYLHIYQTNTEILHNCIIIKACKIPFYGFVKKVNMLEHVTIVTYSPPRV